jgi:ribosomal protein S6--L-glutamate ligase
MIIGIPRNPYAPNVPRSLSKCAERVGIDYRVIDLATLEVIIEPGGQAAVVDREGSIHVDCVGPYLLFGYPVAIHGLRILLRTAFSQNPLDGVLIADDKAATAERLSWHGVPQAPTVICPLDLDHVLSVAGRVGYPVVVKRTHGAQGRWVRRAADPGALQAAFDELVVEGPSALLLQPEIVEAKGRSTRIVITGGRLLAATQRSAGENEWRTNVFGGASQRPVDLVPTEKEIALQAAEALKLGHAGVDLLRTRQGPIVLEVNACPDFTSMVPYFDEDLASRVLASSMGEAPA